MDDLTGLEWQRERDPEALERGIMTRGTWVSSDRDTRAVDFGQVRGRRHRDGVPKYHTIKTVADALDVSSRTVRRGIANGDLVVHRMGGIVRIADDDLRAFLALRRQG